MPALPAVNEIERSTVARLLDRLLAPTAVEMQTHAGVAVVTTPLGSLNRSAVRALLHACAPGERTSLARAAAVNGAIPVPDDADDDLLRRVAGVFCHDSPGFPPSARIPLHCFRPALADAIAGAGIEPFAEWTERLLRKRQGQSEDPHRGVSLPDTALSIVTRFEARGRQAADLDALDALAHDPRLGATARWGAEMVLAILEPASIDAETKLARASALLRVKQAAPGADNLCAFVLHAMTPAQIEGLRLGDLPAADQDSVELLAGIAWSLDSRRRLALGRSLLPALGKREDDFQWTEETFALLAVVDREKARAEASFAMDPCGDIEEIDVDRFERDRGAAILVSEREAIAYAVGPAPSNDASAAQSDAQSKQDANEARADAQPGRCGKRVYPFEAGEACPFAEPLARCAVVQAKGFDPLPVDLGWCARLCGIGVRAFMDAIEPAGITIQLDLRESEIGTLASVPVADLTEVLERAMTPAVRSHAAALIVERCASEPVGWHRPPSVRAIEAIADATTGANAEHALVAIAGVGLGREQLQIWFRRVLPWFEDGTVSLSRWLWIAQRLVRSRMGRIVCEGDGRRLCSVVMQRALTEPYVPSVTLPAALWALDLLVRADVALTDGEARLAVRVAGDIARHPADAWQCETARLTLLELQVLGVDALAALERLGRHPPHYVRQNHDDPGVTYDYGRGRRFWPNVRERVLSVR